MQCFKNLDLKMSCIGGTERANEMERSGMERAGACRSLERSGKLFQYFSRSEAEAIKRK
jgi:hypothetical protein